MRLGVLGPLEVDGLTPLRPRSRTVLTALAVHPRSPVTPGELADAVWHDAPPPSWSKQVQICVWDLRKALGAHAVETVDGGYRLAEGAVDLDSSEFEALVGRGRNYAATGEPAAAAAAFDRALGLWRGRPFPDAEGWMPARHEIARLEELRRAVEEDVLDARLAAGEHRDVVGLAELRAAEEPLRERRWALLALAHYRAGNQAAALRTLRRARLSLVEELGIDPGPELVALEAAMLGQDPALQSEPVPTDSGRCPYRGLAPYGAEDADLFFGRDEDIAACLERLEHVRLLVLAGPSGCGKSSLVRAGLMPVLHQRHLAVATMVPGPNPDAALSGALAAGVGRPILFVDQVEELFAGQHDPAAITAFCERLAAYARTGAPVLATVRSDHLGTLADQPALARLLEQGLYAVTPLSGVRLRRTIEAPAAAVGLRLEAGLVDLLVAEIRDEPGALPLLSHVLAETWARRDGRVLTVAAYQATGGIGSAVARSAEQLHDSLPSDQRATLRSLLLRMVTPSEDGGAVRTHLDPSRLSDDPVRRQVLDLLVSARLVTRDESSVQLAHEAVARAWPRLTAWLEEDAAGQRLMRHLAVAADGWDALDRPTSELYRGGRLETALEWRAAARPDLTDVERAFLGASSAAADSEQRALRTTNRRLRGAVAGIAALLVLALVGGVLALVQSRRAGDERRQAQISALTSAARTVRGSQRDVAALLAIEAYRLRPDAASEAALFGTFTADPGIARTVRTGIPLSVIGGSAAWLADTDRVAFADDHGAVQLLDLASGERTSLEPLSAETGWSLVGASADGRYLAAAWRAGFEPETGTVTVYDLATEARRFDPIRVPFRIGTVALSPDGTTLVVSGGPDARILLFDGATGTLRRELPPIPPPTNAHNSVITAAAAFAPDGRLAVGSQTGTVRIVDPASGKELSRFETGVEQAGSYAVFLDDGASLLIGGAFGVGRYDPTTGANEWTEPRQIVTCNAMAVLETRSELMCGEWSGRVVTYDLDTGSLLGPRFDSQLGNVCAIAVSPDGARMAELTRCDGAGLAVVEWRLDGGGAASHQVRPPDDDVWIERFGFAGRDDIVVSTPAGGRVLDPRSGAVHVELPGVYVVGPTADPARVVAVFERDDATAVGLYDIALREPVGAPVDAGVSVENVATDGERAYVIGDGGTRLRTVDLAARRLTEPSLDLPQPASYLSVVTGDSGELYVVHFDPSSSLDVSTIERLDTRTGAVLASSPPGYTQLGTGGGHVVAVTGSGMIAELDPQTLQPVGAVFPGTVGGVVWIDVDASGRRVALLGFDETARVFDVESRTQLGDPIDLDGADGSLALRDDGNLLALTTSAGLVTWGLDPDHWIAAACQVAGRDLTAAEWDHYVGDLAEPGATC